MAAAEDTQDLDPIDPALEAALARDGASMTQLARLTGLDYRTIRRWRVLERLADRGVPPVEVARAADALTAVAKMLWGILPRSQKRSETDLQTAGDETITAAMNANVLKAVAADVWKRTRGQGFVSITKRIPRDQAERLEETAARMGMDSSDLIRAMLETQLPQRSET